MYLSAERLALANQTVQETFEQCSVAWQAIPHWETGDPGQNKVPDDIINAPGFLNLGLAHEDFPVTLVQTTAPTPDSLMAEVIAATSKLAQSFDVTVLNDLGNAAFLNFPIAFNSTQSELLDSLIVARAKVEDEGYRAPSCLITNTKGLQDLSRLDAGYPITEALLDSAHVNSLHRTSVYNAGDVNAVYANGDPANPVQNKPPVLMVMLGRRQLIPHRGAPEASAGEEPVDIAVSVLPSLEVVGETANSNLELSVRIRFVLRIKDEKPLVLLYGTPVVPGP